MNQSNILKVLPTEGLEPRLFLRHCFGIAHLSPERLLEEETQSQYRKNCITLLSSVFNIERATVRNWGNGLNFEGIPSYCKIGLAYAHTAGVTSQAENILNGDYVPPVVEAQDFLEAVLLNDLSSEQKVRVISRFDFHKNCTDTLTVVLHVGTRCVQKWGQDISFNRMPRVHKHTLAYALAAINQASTSKPWEEAA